MEVGLIIDSNEEAIVGEIYPLKTQTTLIQSRKMTIGDRMEQLHTDTSELNNVKDASATFLIRVLSKSTRQLGKTKVLKKNKLKVVKTSTL